MVLIGIIALMDHMKEGVKTAIEQCCHASIRVVMITGDNIDTAVAIAKGCNIASSRSQAILGDSFMDKIGGIICANCEIKSKQKLKEKESEGRALTEHNDTKSECKCPRTKEEWKLKFKQNKRREIMKENPTKYHEDNKTDKLKTKFNDYLDDEADQEFKNQKIEVKEDAIANIDAFREIIQDLRVIARSQPSHKYALITGLRQLEYVVAVTGDGTNDAPALSKADVGFAMNNGTDIAKEAADIILLDNQFSSIIKAIKWGRNIFDNIQRFLQFQLSVNVVACILVMIGASVGQESPLTAIQMLWVNMIMDSLGSLALASEKPTDDLLNRGPNKRSDFIINPKMMKHIIGQSIYQLIILFVILFSAPVWLKEYQPDFQREGFLLATCFGPEIPVYYENDLNETNMYVISGLASMFSNSTNVTWTGSQSDLCLEAFAGRRNIKSAYNYFREEFSATTHYTVVFNTFVLCQLFNEICCRVIDDGFNIFVRIETNLMFIVIWIVEIGAQALIVLFTTFVFNVSSPSISAEHWGICLAFAFLTFPVNFLLKLLPDPCAKEDKTLVQSGPGKSLQDQTVLGSIRGGNFAKRNSMKRDGSKSMYVY
jgi:Ca2+ transporting ATPase